MDAARAGRLKKNLAGEAEYLSFVPTPLPPRPSLALDDALVETLVRANRSLASLNTVVSRIPDVALFISMYVRKEALMSSQIEGTQATLDDVLDPLADDNANRDVADVVNYIKATQFAIEQLTELPLGTRLMKQVHGVLMAGVRGQEKDPGEFRHSQNWIGGQASTLRNARYIPPTPDDMIEAMSDLEKYMNADDRVDTLIRAGLVHYQFETIHPFLDGNGRVGRLLITLFLMDKDVLSSPALYISYFLKAHRTEYYDRLSEVRRTGDYEQWVRFFLEAVAATAEDATVVIDQLATLHDKNLATIARMGRGAASAARVFSYVEAHPIIEIGRTAEALGMAYNTVASAVSRLQSASILARRGGLARRRTFSYEPYLELLRGGTL